MQFFQQNKGYDNPIPNPSFKTWTYIMQEWEIKKAAAQFDTKQASTN